MAAHARHLFSGCDGVDRDVAASIELNEKAVRRGHKPAAVHLAVQIRLGLLPGEVDHGRAAKLLSEGSRRRTVARNRVLSGLHAARWSRR
jgi:TPR repeat protein